MIADQTTAGPHPGRMVDPTSFAAAYLRHAGLRPTDVPGDGAWVSLTEARAETARRGVTVTVPPPPPEMTPERALNFVRPMLRLGAHLIRLHPDSKTPVESAWQHAPALSEADAVAWLLDSGDGRQGNLGVNLARSGANGWGVIDAENAAATAVVLSAGFIPTAVTANAQDPTSPKHGGCHVWFPIPDDVDATALRSRLQVPLPGGGLVDALVGSRFVVAPGSALACAPGYRYGFAGGGAVADNSKWRHPPRWLVDPGAPLPEALAALPGLPELHAVFAAAPRRPRRAPDANSDRLTSAVDEVSWEEWLAGHPAIEVIGVDGACGCPVFHYRGASTLRSGILHDGCDYGFGAHIFSGTLIGLMGRDHLSRLDFAAWLHGESLSTTAARVGVSLREPLVGVDPGAFRYTPPAPPAPTPPPARVAGPDPAPPGPVAPELAADPPAEDSDGEPAPADEPATPVLDPRAELEARDDSMSAEDWKKIAGLRGEIKLREQKLATMTPGLARADVLARCHGVYLHGLVTALVVRTIANVPPNVVLPSRTGLMIDKAIGGSVNANGMLAGPSAAGKTNTMSVARSAIPVRGHGVVSISDGTAEGICRKARAAAGKGKVRIFNTGILIETDEFDSVAAEMARPGSKLDAFTRKVWMGGEAGSTASDQNKDAQLPPHSTRICLLYGAQPGALAPMIAQNNRGTPQRFDFGLAGVVLRADRDPLFGTVPPAPILANQQNLPWWTPTGLPPGYTPPTGDDDDAGEDAEGVPSYDDAAPVWVRIPPAVQAVIDEQNDHAGHRAADWNLARWEDEEGISGHTIPLRLRIAFALAVWDGFSNIELVHWEAAGLLIEMRQLVFDAVMIESKTAWVKERRNEGADRGVVQAEARIAEAEHTSAAQQSACDRIMTLVDAAAGVAEQARLAARVIGTKPWLFAAGGVNTVYLSALMSKRQRAHIPTALRALREQGLLVGESVVRRPTAVPTLRLVPPVIGTVSGVDEEAVQSPA